MSATEITIKNHRYKRSRFSGAGNCWCGRADRAKIHLPSRHVRPRVRAWARFICWTFRYRRNARAGEER